MIFSLYFFHKYFFKITFIFRKNILSLHLEIKKNIMKKDIHPASYRPVVFKDISTDEAFITKSCVNTKDTITWEDGNEYPLVKVEKKSLKQLT